MDHMNNKKSFSIIVLIFSLIMITIAVIMLYISNNMSDLKETTLDTYPRLKDYKIIIPEGITDLDGLESDSLGLIVAYVDKQEKTIFLSISDKKVNKDNWIFVPETKRTYINISDSTYED